MRVYVNEPLVERRTMWGRRIMSVGFAVLLLAALLSFNRLTLVQAYAVMLAGLILLNIGLFTGGKHMRRPRADEILAKAVRGVNHNSQLYNYLLPADHVIVSPAGIHVLLLKFQDGQITARGDQWRRRLNLSGSIRALFEPRLGNPGRQARNEAARVQGWLHTQLPDADVPVNPVIVFVNPKARLLVEGAAVPALVLADLKAYLRAHTKTPAIQRDTLATLAALCEERSS